ncbi:hypothetical protein AB6D20_027945 (plasmid) [Vibrio splendidus]
MENKAQWKIKRSITRYYAIPKYLNSGKPIQANACAAFQERRPVRPSKRGAPSCSFLQCASCASLRLAFLPNTFALGFFAKHYAIGFDAIGFVLAAAWFILAAAWFMGLRYMGLRYIKTQ